MAEQKKIAVAVVGATGAVGEALLSVLVERNFPVGKLYALARGKSTDDAVMFNERPVLVEAVDGFDFALCQLVFFCAPKSVAKKYAPRAVKAGCWVIDVSSQFRLDDDVPLVVPEINADLLGALTGPQIIASPAAPVIQACAALFPLRQKFGLLRADITTLLAVSALGKSGVSELAGQTARLLNVQAIEQKAFPSQIAFNLLPAFDASADSGYTLDELNTAKEVKKLLREEHIQVVASQAFAPVFYGHTQTLRLEATTGMTIQRARESLSAAGLEFGEVGELLSSVAIGTGSDAVFVSRCAQQMPGSRQLELWTVADNIRKGAALNTVAIAETLLKSHL
ncbi:MAG TPA: aspartate-semialdehyde dehydrogenase [Spongiibacteraceae bacterium]|nr:aspartate-semialdehyde dehydrogenase [Spongiibacteraceae bacterium]